MHRLLCVGEIVNTHGIRGEVKVVPLTDDVSKFDNLKSFIIDGTTYNLETIREHKNMLLIKLQEINDMDAAQKLKGKFLEVSREALEPLEEGQYYICDIIGLEIIDEDIGKLGVIEDIQQTGSNDVYITTYEGKPLCVPALKDVIQEVNLNEGYMKVKLPKGLI